MSYGTFYRKLVPELLDALPANHPDALRSRRDLRMIHFLMGNECWMLSEIKRISLRTRTTFIEIGAGDGSFSQILATRHPQAQIHAYDLLAAPTKIPNNVTWHSGDIRDFLPPPRDKDTTMILVSSMFLHHFEDEELCHFRPWIEQCDCAIIAEPWRNRGMKFLSQLIHPFCNKVTRHDMEVSIAAGFRGNELVDSLDISDGWTIKITHHWRGAHRLILQRRETH